MNKSQAVSVRARLLNVAKAQGVDFNQVLIRFALERIHLLGFGPSDLESIARTFQDIASVEVRDGIIFDPTSVTVNEIRKNAGYAGAQVLITGEIAKARCKTQIDIGFGDAVTPGPIEAIYPVLLGDLPAPGCEPILSTP